VARGDRYKFDFDKAVVVRQEQLSDRRLLTWEQDGTWHVAVVDYVARDKEHWTYKTQEDAKDAAACVRAGLPNR